MAADGDDGANQCYDDDIYSLIYKLQQSAEDYEPIDKSLAERIVRRSHREIKALTLQQKSTPAKFHLDEIKVGPLCGTGGFSSVYEISSLKTISDHPDFTLTENKARKNLVDSCKITKGKGRYALKHLRPKLMQKPKKFANGAIDLAVEAAYLSSLDHPNILKIRGVSANGVDGLAKGKHNSYYLIIDRLEKTLEDRISEWRKQLKRLNNKLYAKFMDKKGKKRAKLLAERLRVAHDIASALDYLHRQRLVYRDLKSSNLGFDADGKVQLFDFGLCRELLPSKEESGKGDENEVFKMSGGVGTYRYMAPEVARKLHYNQKADVYSYGMVLHEILSLNQPSLDKKHKNNDDEVPIIAEGSLRLCKCWPQALRDMITLCTSHDIAKRPTMKQICSVLQYQIAALVGKNDIVDSEEKVRSVTTTTTTTCLLDKATSLTRINNKSSKPIRDSPVYSATTGTSRTLSLGPSTISTGYQ
eukprot:CAMPEP_0202458798 /NCGR_PEP_ID=MMETSP1360-20130828/28281_1 /ASSEMBLY_ACC=CAM_ASM_000848 /TAXON_ID=515479 /ORGANISM="Licmophora paradoxa, Strain CCMP2313" /LENGTH=472 /DNA_ID=CAMNT_0049079529 /DNA_START=113 /DNA_END=1531 /DNA_ORIENTATION=+